MQFANTYCSIGRTHDGIVQAGEPRATTEFLMRCILGARTEVGFESTQHGQHEDVNVYLANLLGAAFSPHHLTETQQYLHVNELDLYRAVESSGDDRMAFRLYKVNADYLLLAIGIFNHVEGTHHPGAPLAHRTPDEFVSRGGTYYLLASSYLRRLRRRSTAPEQILQKLAEHFGPYVEVMRRVRSTYFHLTARIGDGTLYHLMQQPGEGEAAVEYTASEAHDAFLDAYSTWKANPCAETVGKLREAAEQVKAVDVDFAFELPHEGGPEGVSGT